MNTQFMGCSFESESQESKLMEELTNEEQQVCLHLTEDETPSGSPEEFTGFLASPRENAARPVLRGPSWAWSSVYDQSAMWSPFPEPLVDKRSTILCNKPAGSTALSWRPTLSPQDPSLSPYQYERFGSVELMSGTRRKIAAQDATATLKAWLNEHRKNPYPTKGEKIMLAIITRMTLTQVSNWFANARRRLKKGEKGMLPSDENTACPEAVHNAGNGDEPREYEGVTDEELPLPNLQDFEAGFGDQNTSQTTVMESSSAPKRQMPGTLSTAELQSKRSLCFERSKSCHEMCDKTGVRTSEGKMFAAGGNFELCTGLSMINAQSHRLSYFVKPGDGGIEAHRGDDEQLASACMRSGQANLMLNTDVAHRDSLTKRVNSWSLAHPAVFCCHQPFSVSRESCSQPCKLRGWVDGELQAEPCQRRGMPMTHTTVPLNFVVSPNISTGCSTSKQVLACLPMSDILPPPFNSSAPTLKAD